MEIDVHHPLRAHLAQPDMAAEAPQPPDPSEIRQVKLRLPVEQVMKLHHLRILRSEPISSFVANALEEYFEKEREARAVARQQ